MIGRPLVVTAAAALLLGAAVGCARRSVAQGAPARGGTAVFETVYLWEGPAPGANTVDLDIASTALAADARR